MFFALSAFKAFLNLKWLKFEMKPCSAQFHCFLFRLKIVLEGSRTCKFKSPKAHYVKYLYKVKNAYFSGHININYSLIDGIAMPTSHVL